MEPSRHWITPLALFSPLSSLSILVCVVVFTYLFIFPTNDSQKHWKKKFKLLKDSKSFKPPCCKSMKLHAPRIWLHSLETQRHGGQANFSSSKRWLHCSRLMQQCLNLMQDRCCDAAAPSVLLLCRHHPVTQKPASRFHAEEKWDEPSWSTQTAGWSAGGADQRHTCTVAPKLALFKVDDGNFSGSVQLHNNPVSSFSSGNYAANVKSGKFQRFSKINHPVLAQ